MRKALTMVVAGLVLAGCGGGSSLAKDDKALADRFWDNLSTVERDLLCEEMSTASGRYDAVEKLGSVLLKPAIEKFGDDGSAENFADLVEGTEVNDKRAEAIVLYLNDDKC
jgi:hypothetical protein